MIESINRDNIEQCFRYVRANTEQQAAFEALTEQFLEAGNAVLDYCHDSPDRDKALEHLRAARMWANSSIAHNGRF